MLSMLSKILTNIFDRNNKLLTLTLSYTRSLASTLFGLAGMTNKAEVEGRGGNKKIFNFNLVRIK
jgi:hypothetical protein